MSVARSEHEKNIRQNCCLNGSELCHWLDKTGCIDCYIATLKHDSAKKEALDRWKVTLSYLPSDIDDMHMTDDCQFCKNEVNKATGYAIFDMSHPEPKSEKGMFFGIGKKVRAPIGSLITVQASICSSCKKAYRLVDIIQLLTPILFVTVSIILLMIPSFAQSLTNLFAFMPLIFVGLMGIVGFYLGKIVSTSYFKKMSKSVKFDLSEISQIKRMLNNDWSFFQCVNDMPRLSFTKVKNYKSLRKESLEPKKAIIESDITLDNFNI